MPRVKWKTTEDISDMARYAASTQRDSYERKMKLALLGCCRGAELPPVAVLALDSEEKDILSGSIIKNYAAWHKLHDYVQSNTDYNDPWHGRSNRSAQMVYQLIGNRGARRSNIRPVEIEATARMMSEATGDAIPVSRIREAIRDVFGPDPRKPAPVIKPEWRTDTVIALAREMDAIRDYSAMPILADALQDAGCDNPDILDHCRGNTLHVRGNWLIADLLGQNINRAKGLV